MLENSWKFLTVYAVCFLIGLILKFMVFYRFTISEKQDRVIRGILLMSPPAISLILSSTHTMSIYDINNYIFPTIGLAGGWLFGKSRVRKGNK